MSKIVMFNMVTLDGFFAGPNGEIDWHRVDEEFNQFAVQQTGAAGGLIFGRVTYQLMESYWPTEDGTRDDPEVAAIMNAIPKLVFSRTLERADWNNTRLVKTDAVEEITKLRQQPGEDWLIFGSAGLIATLTGHRLIDEYRLIVAPVVLGQGKPVFKDVQDRLNFKLLSTRTFDNGNVLLCYAPA